MCTLRASLRGSLAFIAGLAAACSESPAGPRVEPQEDRLDSLIVNASVVRTRLADRPDLPAGIECRIGLEVRAADGAAGPIELQRIDFASFTGVDRDVPLDSVVAPANWVDLEFGTLAVTRQPLASEWDFDGRAPFEVRGTVHYVDHTGDVGAASFSLPCGPEPQDDLAGPTVTEVVTAPTETVEVGDPVSIGYRASAPLGLWETWSSLRTDRRRTRCASTSDSRHRRRERWSTSIRPAPCSVTG